MVKVAWMLAVGAFAAIVIAAASCSPEFLGTCIKGPCGSQIGGSAGVADSGGSGGDMTSSAGAAGNGGGSGGSTTSSVTGGSGGTAGNGGSGGAGGAGGNAGQGGGLPPVLCGPDQVPIPQQGVVICWYVAPVKHVADATIHLGGSIFEAGMPESTADTFPGCATVNPSDSTLVCSLGTRASGTDFLLRPYQTNGVIAELCDLVSVPNHVCYSGAWLYADGVLIDEYPPIGGHWSYDTSGTFLEMLFTNTP